MSDSCRTCGRSSPHAFLCGVCKTELRNDLLILSDGPILEIKGVPVGDGSRGEPFIEALEDAVYSQTRLGESARRSSEPGRPLPVNLTASNLLDDVNHTLQNWVGHLFKKIGLPL